jgi:hypothetical protein
MAKGHGHPLVLLNITINKLTPNYFGNLSNSSQVFKDSNGKKNLNLDLKM